MNKLQKKQLEMYDDLRNILISKNITFFAIGGTAIGAVREAGFIPGDDDIDLAIKEEQYLEFKDAINSSRFELKTKKANADDFDEESDLIYFLKVYDPKIGINENGCEVNLYIDIMIAQKKREYGFGKMFKFHFYNLIAHSKKFKYRDIKRWDGFFVAFGYSIFRLLFSWISTRRLKKGMDNLIFNTKKDVEQNGMYYTYHVAHDEYWNVDQIVDYKFENTIMPVTKTFKEDIKHIFGDVMERPDKESQKSPHKIELIKK